MLGKAWRQFLIEVAEVTKPELLIGVIVSLAALTTQHFLLGGISINDAISVIVPFVWVIWLGFLYYSYKAIRRVYKVGVTEARDWVPRIPEAIDLGPKVPSRLRSASILLASAVVSGVLVVFVTAAAKRRVEPTTSPQEIIVETGRAILIEWKLDGDVKNGKSSLVGSLKLDTEKLRVHVPHRRILLVCVITPTGSDGRTSVAINRGPLSVIFAETKLTCPVSFRHALVLLNPATVHFYALMVANSFDVSTITTVQDAIDRGAILVAAPEIRFNGVKPQ